MMLFAAFFLRYIYFFALRAMRHATLMIIAAHCHTIDGLCCYACQRFSPKICADYFDAADGSQLR